MATFYDRQTGELTDIGDDEPVAFLEPTTHGFRYGRLHVEATSDLDGRVAVTLWTGFGKKIEVRCSPLGRFLSVWNKGTGSVSGVSRDGA